MSIIKEFKEFAVKGSVIDLAVGVIIGGAFGKIVSSLVADIIMPALGILLKGINFSGLSYTIGNSTITYGNFIQSVIDFLIISLVIFLIIRQINKLKRPMPAAAPAPAISREEELLTEIRDLLKNKP